MAFSTSRQLSSNVNAAAAADPGVQRLLSFQFPLAPDLLSPVQLHRLKATLAPYLPKPKPGVASVPLMPDVRLQKQAVPVPPGQHLIFFNDALPEADLDSDGYDGVRSPRGRWSRRMWAGGSVTHKPNALPQLEEGRRAYCQESVEKVDIKPGPNGDSFGDKMFVWFKRKLWAGGIYGNNDTGAASSASSGRPETEERSDEECPIIERRCLVYMPERTKTAEPAKPSRIVKPPHEPSFSHTFTPSATLLFRYSALTFNAHKIHIDPSFAKDVESHPDIIVHGPLMLTFLMELLRINVLEGPNGEPNGKALDSFEYKNLAPLYVDKPCRICGREVGSKNEQDGSQLYELWAEGAEGGYAVKGTAVVKDIRAAQTPKL